MMNKKAQIHARDMSVALSSAGADGTGRDTG